MPKVSFELKNGKFVIPELGEDGLETWNPARDAGMVSYFTEKDGKYYWAGSLEVYIGDITEVYARVWKDGVLRETWYTMFDGIVLPKMDRETACEAPQAREGDMD